MVLFLWSIEIVFTDYLGCCHPIYITKLILTTVLYTPPLLHLTNSHQNKRTQITTKTIRISEQTSPLSEYAFSRPLWPMPLPCMMYFCQISLYRARCLVAILTLIQKYWLIKRCKYNRQYLLSSTAPLLSCIYV